MTGARSCAFVLSSTSPAEIVPEPEFPVSAAVRIGAAAAMRDGSVISTFMSAIAPRVGRIRNVSPTCCGAADLDLEAIGDERIGGRAGAGHRHRGAGEGIAQLPAAARHFEDVVAAGQRADVGARRGNRAGAGVEAVVEHFARRRLRRNRRRERPCRSMPSRCCAFTTSLSATAMRPSALCAGSSCSLRKSSRPPSAPPETLRLMSTELPGVCRAIVSRVESNGSCTVVSWLHVRAEHQRLAAADEHVDGAAVLLHGVDGNLLRQLVEQAVALIEQVVRRLPAGAGDARGDLVVQPRDALRERVDLGHFALDARIDLVADLVQARVEELAGAAASVLASLSSTWRAGIEVGEFATLWNALTNFCSVALRPFAESPNMLLRRSALEA